MKTRELMNKGEAFALMELGCIVYTALYNLRRVKPKKMWSEISIQKRAAILARWIEPESASPDDVANRAEYLQRNFAEIFGEMYSGDKYTLQEAMEGKGSNKE